MALLLQLQGVGSHRVRACPETETRSRLRQVCRRRDRVGSNS